MVFPQTQLPVVVEIAPGAAPATDPSTWTWVDVTAFVRLRDKITITEGSSDWGDRPDAGSCSLNFDNRTGDFAQHNPAGQWYGRLGRDTPLRVRLRRVEDGFGRTSLSGWGTAPSGQEWGIGSGTPSDMTVSGGVGRHAHPTVNVYRNTLLPTTLLDSEQLVDVAPSVLLTGAALVTGFLFRYQDASNYYWARAEFNAGGTTMMLKISRVVDGVHSDLAVLNPVPSLAYSAGGFVRVRAAIDGQRIGIKVWPVAGVEPAGWQLTATDQAITRPGQVGLQSWVVSGNTNTPPVMASFDNYRCDVDLFGGTVPTWVPRSDLTGRDRIVPVVARGVLYRLKPSAGKPPTRSAMRRTIPATGAVAYWPVEDGTDASAVGSAYPGHQPLAITGPIEFRDIEAWQDSRGYEVRYGTAALADVSAGGSLSATVPPEVTAATAGGWTVSVTADTSGGTGSGDYVLAEVATPGGTPYVRWQLVITTSNRTRIIGHTADGTVTWVADAALVFEALVPHNFAVYQDGAGVVRASYWWDSVSGYAITGSTPGTIGGITRVSVNPTRITSTVSKPVGHIAVWPGHDLPAVDARDGAVLMALFGFSWTNIVSGSSAATGEAATVRLARLCAEDGMPLDLPAVAADDEMMMGVQRPGTPLELYQQCEDADLGVLYERPFSLAYQPRVARYNQQPTLVVDATGGDLAEPPSPDMEGQAYRNRQTVERIDGSSAVAETPEVAAGDAVVYDDSVSLNLISDLPLPDVAGFRLHLSSSDGLRWPQLELDLAARPELIDAWLSCRIGSRISAINPPEDVAGQDIDVILEGRTVTLGFKDFDVVANCSPAQPWEVAAADGVQRAGADGTTLTALITAAATSAQITSTALNGPWTTDPSDFPLDIRIGGERVTVSGITGGGLTQTITISARGVNGVQRSWPAGTAVDVWQPAIAPL